MTRSIRKRTLLLATCVPAFMLGATMSAIGQSIPSTGVAIPAPELGAEYAPKGLPMGQFRLFPTLGVTFDYDDNVYRTQTNTKADTFFEVSPRVALQSEWTQHYLALKGGLTSYSYNSFNKEDRVDWDAGAEGRADIQRGTFLAGGVNYRHTFEPRASPDQVLFAAEPTPFNVLHADARVESKPNRFGVAAGVNFDRYEYDPTKLLPSGTSSNRDRNYDMVEVYGRASYEFSPGYSAFAHFGYNTREFKLNIDRNGVNRDSTGYRVNGGLQMELTRLITGEFYGGYIVQQYKSPLGEDNGFNFGANLAWTPTPVVTVRLGASHLMNETVVATATGVATDSNEERVSLGVDYGFRPNIILHGDIAYLHDTFTGAGRTDNLFAFSLGATYLINNYMNVTAGYIYNERDSNALLQDFKDNMLRIGIGFQL